MSKTLFIADLHLDKRYPKAVSAFLLFLRDIETQDIDALYILGDLFEYWLGDDCMDKTAKSVADGLANYHDNTGTPIYFIHGNRDFLLGEEYAAQCKMQILPEHSVIKLYEIETLVLHGDTLCTDDIDYMRFRERVHSPQWQAKILRLPRWVRRLKAQQLRRQSKKANAKKTQEIMDVSPDAVNDIVQQYGVKRLIHGHTHRPALHALSRNGEPIFRCVVGDWYTQGSVLEVTKGFCQLTTLSYER